MSRPERAARAERAASAAEVAAPRAGLARLWDQVGTLVVAVALALAIRAVLIEPYRIPSGSMLPTLLIGDHLFVNKFAYGVKLPFGERRLPGLRAPERGDVVVFTVARGRDGSIHPADRRPDLPRDRFVKRIVGLPGDVVEVRAGRVWLNGAALPLEGGGERFSDEVGRALRVWHEQLGEGGHAILDDPQQPGPPQARLTVEPGRYFVMGDNRDYSNDSRTWGTVRLAELKGPAFLIYWSWDWNGSWLSLLNPLTWWDLLVHRMRWERIGDGIP